jgi:phage recombination protein Bet
MSTAVSKTDDAPRHKPHEQAVMPLRGPRLPFHPLVEERFGVDRASWKALVEAIFPNATCVESVVLALSYCKARRLDPFKRCVHIVPIWNKEQRCYVDTVWPGIGELRTTAFRTGEYAGRGETALGPDRTEKLGSIEMTYPEWAQVTVYRMVKGQRVEFHGPRVYWIETYATIKRGDDTPNDMWRDRPRGQLEKCAEAAALRGAFPEEIGGDYIPEEVERGGGGKVVDAKRSTIDDLTSRLEGPSPELPATVSGESPDDSHQGEAAEDATQEVEPYDYAAYFRDCQLQTDVASKLAELESLNDPEIDYKALEAAAEARRAEIKASRGERSNAK